jgi:hypothetical protein
MTQGVVASALTGSQVPVYLVSGGWHVPMSVRDGMDLNALIRDAEVHARPVSACTADILASLNAEHGPDGRDPFHDHFQGVYSVFSLRASDRIARDYYSMVLSLRGRGRRLAVPRLVLVRGNEIVACTSRCIGVIREFEELFERHFLSDEKNLLLVK